jgi:hypothetical protein
VFAHDKRHGTFAPLDFVSKLQSGGRRTDDKDTAGGQLAWISVIPGRYL